LTEYAGDGIAVLCLLRSTTVSMLFSIRPSATYVLMLLVVHLLAVASIFLTNLALWARLCIALLIFASMLLQIYRHMRTGWRSFSLNRRRVAVSISAGNILDGELAHQTVVTPCCVVLCVSLKGRALPVCQVIFPDAMQADAFRELRVRLKFS